jgi:hypothetical protein
MEFDYIYTDYFFMGYYLEETKGVPLEHKQRKSLCHALKGNYGMIHTLADAEAGDVRSVLPFCAHMAIGGLFVSKEDLLDLRFQLFTVLEESESDADSK